MIVKQEISPENLGVLMEKGGDFNISTKARKFFITNTIVSNCTIETSESKVVSSCGVDMKNGNGKDRFYENKTTISCTGKDNQIKNCHVEVKGRTKGFVMRTPTRLALSGAEVVLRGMTKTNSYLTNGTLDGSEDEDFYKSNIEGIWDYVMKSEYDGETLNHKIEVVSSPTGYLIRK